MSFSTHSHYNTRKAQMGAIKELYISVPDLHEEYIKRKLISEYTVFFRYFQVNAKGEFQMDNGLFFP